MILNDIVAVSGLLLTLTTFLFNLAWPKINKALELDESVSGVKAQKRCRDKVIITKWLIVFPMFLAFFMLFYVNLPTAIKVLTSSKFSIWYFDVDNTLYVMVVFALFAFVFFNGYIFIRLFIKQTKFQ